MAKQVQKFDYKSIKSFEDACRHLNLNPEDIPDVSKLPEEFQRTIINHYKLCIIYKAINNGWKPDWSNYNEYKYFPWFKVDASSSSPSGVGFSDSGYDCACTHASVGSHLCTDSAEKASYIAETFKEEYKQFLLIAE